MQTFKKLAGLMLVVSSLSVTSVFAGVCEIQYTREACPGKEKISFKKCNGSASCSKFVEVASADECKAKATQACANDRLSITKSKVINALFEEQALKTDAGSDDFCTVYEKVAEEFNHCNG